MGLDFGAERLAAKPRPGAASQTAADRDALQPLIRQTIDRGGGAQSPHAAAIGARKGFGPDP